LLSFVVINGINAALDQLLEAIGYVPKLIHRASSVCTVSTLTSVNPRVNSKTEAAAHAHLNTGIYVPNLCRVASICRDILTVPDEALDARRKYPCCKAFPEVLVLQKVPQNLHRCNGVLCNAACSGTSYVQQAALDG
jgi:hypothetical protein